MNWMSDYEQAFLRANGEPCKVVICGGGWYRISHASAPSVAQRHRKIAIIEMTARLEQRIEQEAAED